MASRLLSLFVGGALVTGSLLAGSAAQAVSLTDDERAAGLWYADGLLFDELQAKGATGKGVKIAVIDIAVNPDIPELAGANIKVKGSYCAFPDTGEPVPAVSDDVERAGHGTDVVAMLVGNGIAADGGPGTRGIVPEAEIWFYATGLPEEASRGDVQGCEKYDGSRGEFYDTEGLSSDSPDYFLGGETAYAAWNAVRDGADIVVYSGIGTDAAGWTQAVKEGLRAGVPVVVGTPNPDGNMQSQLERNFPYRLNGAVGVSGVDGEGRILTGGGDRLDPLYGEALGSQNLGFVSAASRLLVPSGKEGWGASLGSGTSLATPLVAGVIALGMQAYPDATANQVLQVMIRTTGAGGVHEPEWGGDKEGYGLANPLAVLEVDPAAYPDENPLFAASPDDPRCIEPGREAPNNMDGCIWAGGPTSEQVWPAGETSGEKPGEPVAEVAVPWAGAVTVVVVLLLVGIIATAIIVPIAVSRSRKRNTQPPQQWASNSKVDHG